MDCVLHSILLVVFNLNFNAISILLILRLVLTFSVEVKKLVIDFAFLLLVLALASVSLLNVLLSHSFVTCLDFTTHLFSRVDGVRNHLELFSHFVVTEDLSFMLIKLSVEFSLVYIGRSFGSPLDELLE